MKLTKLEKFFYDNTGYSYNPQSGLTPRQTHERNAKQLAGAVRYAAAQDWVYEWVPDEPGFEDGNAEVCILRGIDGITLASLCGIVDATDDYRRVVEAQLALEASNL